MTDFIKRVVSAEWTDLGASTNWAFRESDIVYAGGHYYLFATGGYDPARVDVYQAASLGDILSATPYPVMGPVAPWSCKYPTAQLEGDVWHLWGCAGGAAQTWHLVTSAPLSASSRWTRVSANAFGSGDNLLIDASVRKHPTDGYWYAVGFVNMTDAPLTLLRATSPYQAAWENLGDVFEAGEPPWADQARADPNLAFTPDGDYVTFIGRDDGGDMYLSVCGLDLATGRAIKGERAVIDQLPEHPVSELVYLAVPGEPERIFGFQNDGYEGRAEPPEGEWHWGCLELA